MSSEPTVFILDDDPDSLDSLDCLLRSVRLKTATYSTPRSFLDEFDPLHPGCLVLDLRMPEISGLDVQRELLNRGATLPIIVVTGHADMLTCRSAFRNGAFDFLEKPVNDQLLLGRIQNAIAEDARNREVRGISAELRGLVDQLTPREREVKQYILEGWTTKQIATKLGISLQTVAKHRARVLEKLKVSTDVELARKFLLSTIDRP